MPSSFLTRSHGGRELRERAGHIRETLRDPIHLPVHHGNLPLYAQDVLRLRRPTDPHRPLHKLLPGDAAAVVRIEDEEQVLRLLRGDIGDLQDFPELWAQLLTAAIASFAGFFTSSQLLPGELPIPVHI